jgi:modulator of FtsH protease
MNDRPLPVGGVSALPATASNALIRNTFVLLSLVLGTAAVGAGLGLALNIPMGLGMWIVFMVLFIGGPFLLNRIQNGQAQIVATFAWAFAVGLLFSPLVGAYLSFPGGSAIVLNALVTTAVLFTSLAGYAVVSRKDFSFMGGFLFAGIIVVLLAIVANMFLQIPMLSLVISAAAVLLMSALILWETSRLIHEPNANPVMITVGLFSSIVVLFSHLMSLFSALSGDD